LAGNTQAYAEFRMRYEYESPVTERHERSVAHFAFDQPSPIQAQAQANYTLNPIPELLPSQFKVMGGLTFAGVNGSPRTYWQADKTDLMPRFGLAYQLTGSTTLRGGLRYLLRHCRSQQDCRTASRLQPVDPHSGILEHRDYIRSHRGQSAPQWATGSARRGRRPVHESRPIGHVLSNSAAAGLRGLNLAKPKNSAR
jgi:hypothetical protein